MIIDKLTDHHGRKLEQFNDTVVQFRDHALLSASECDDIISAINNRLLAEAGNKTAKCLRHLLSLAIDVIRTEDGIEKLRKT